jgi:hypothetical protein
VSEVVLVLVSIDRKRLLSDCRSQFILERSCSEGAFRHGGS